jgi:hypothetical protein
MTLDVAACETRTVSLDGSTFGTSRLVSGGFLLEQSNGAAVSIGTVQCYDGTLTPALWDNPVTAVPDVVGPGSLYVAASNLGAGVTPSANILICDVQFCGAAAGSSVITIDTIPGFDTWVNLAGTIFDPSIAAVTINATVGGEEPVCGDGTCNGTETCETCPQDCGVCPPPGCEVDEECDNGLYCDGAETCVDGNCQPGIPVDCTDGLDCTTDSCNESTDSCDFTPDNAVCADGNFCNGNEICDAVNGCMAGEPVSCPDDGVFCNGTESCDEAVDSCLSSGNPCPQGTNCREIPDGYICDELPVEGCKSDAECDDGIFCNGTETCNAYAKATGTKPPVTGICKPGKPVDCNDNVDCTIDSCNEAMDKCDHVPDNAVCDDGNFCNGNEVCDPDYFVTIATQEGSGSTSGCKPGDAVTCPDDGKFCNGIESCNEAADSCQSSGNPCTPGVTVCNEKTDTCDPVAGCKSDAECDDGIFCNGIETCNAYAKATSTKPPVNGVCQSGIPVDCSDGVDCTVDSCNEDADSCVNTADDEYCPDDGKFCNGTEFCDAEQGCISTGNPCAAGTACNEEKDSCDVKEITVKMDIKPGSCPNPLNLKSKGVLPVAILGSKDFNVKNIDPATIMLSREGIPGGVSPLRYNYADVATPFEGELCDCNSLYGDGYKDLTLKFKKTEVISELLLEEVAGQTIPLTITFSFKEDKGGTDYYAEDCLKILKKKERKIKFWRDKK